MLRIIFIFDQNRTQESRAISRIDIHSTENDSIKNMMTAKPIVEVLDISIPTEKFQILSKFHLDQPKPETKNNNYTIEISGWVLSQTPVSSLDIMSEGRLVQKISVNRPRPDVAKAHSGVPGVESCGFKAELGVIGLPEKAQLRLRAILEDGRGEFCGSITFLHQPLQTDYEPKLQPLLITSTGRSGTTWLMRLLSNHPQIIISKNYPYENRAALYWMQMLKILSQPSEDSVSETKEGFSEEKNWLGRNALYNSNISSIGGVNWVKQKYPQVFGSFCQQCIDEFYQTIGKEQEQSQVSLPKSNENPVSNNITYFAEKNPFVITPLMEIYPEGREILLVRDFRDMICSIIAFNKKRGFDDFGRQNFPNDEEYIRAIGKNIVRDLPKWKNRSSKTYVVRYEDLILMPIETLSNLLENLKIDHNKLIVENMLEEASKDNPQLKRHRTTASPKESIGRWETYLEPHVQKLCNEVFAEALSEFDYTE